MIGLLIIYFIGKWFYKLAEKHQRQKWLFAILGVVVYYATAILGGFAIILIAVAVRDEEILDSLYPLLGLMGLPIGLLSIWGFHTILRKNWEGNPMGSQTELLDNTEL
jgi:hypothetical protein